MGYKPIFCSFIDKSLRRTIPEESLQFIHRVCSEHDCVLVDFALRGTEHRLILDLFIDNRQGVSLELCATINRALNDDSANDKFLSDVYLLEVSSPGVDRPLTFNWQYEKHIGRLLHLKLKDGTELDATLVSVGPDSVHLQPRARKKGTSSDPALDLPFDHISSSTVQVALR